ncbi:MAG: hypothetical protein CFE21_17535 [Bacteroidetes bacterium B1(2017)]|nr:MAG: hypothetical protein CFE21_17535 [Bacteroidetes bacterium B1(2017)]
MLSKNRAFIAKTKIHIPSLRFYKDIKTERGSVRLDMANCCEFVFYMENQFEHEKDKLISSFQTKDQWIGLFCLRTEKGGNE